MESIESKKGGERGITKNHHRDKKQQCIDDKKQQCVDDSNLDRKTKIDNLVDKEITEIVENIVSEVLSSCGLEDIITNRVNNIETVVNEIVKEKMAEKFSQQVTSKLTLQLEKKLETIGTDVDVVYGQTLNEVVSKVVACAVTETLEKRCAMIDKELVKRVVEMLNCSEQILTLHEQVKRNKDEIKMLRSCIEELSVKVNNQISRDNEIREREHESSKHRWCSIL
ncbi:hypothetical protein YASMINEVIRUS_1409 [Yasminevirus sp. GU-2018]|uniref:Uncharacterized protein n=1 Tax=Yasminevirus sp. GU-2018 TaxID=2420051 RepID=A0A5K0UA62_9VIRU|nr:hypothetical protein YASMINEVIRUS_1409 [Yasminevirus sp. GU-2018]